VKAGLRAGLAVVRDLRERRAPPRLATRAGLAGRDVFTERRYHDAPRHPAVSWVTRGVSR
jgi:hypothetical protein